MSNKDTNFQAQQKKKGFSRRQFLVRGGMALGATAAGLYLFRTPLRRSVAEFIGELEIGSSIAEASPVLWFEVQENNTILMKSPKVEMGQGTFTGFAMLAAEELDVDIEQIHVVPGTSNDGPQENRSTGGSSSTSSLYVEIRKLAASMREMLKTSASSIMDIPIDQLKTARGLISGRGQQITYAEVVAQTQVWNIPEPPPLRPRSSFKYVGKDFPRIDLKPKVMGNPIYAIDAEMPGMLYAICLESPYIGGTLQSLDTTEAMKQEGVIRVVREKGWVAVVAKSRYAAEMGKRKLRATWDVPKVWQQADIDNLIRVGNGPPVNVQKEGKAKRIIREAGASVLKAEYRSPIGVHAQIEPKGAIAHVQHDKATVIGGSQSLPRMVNAVAKATGLKKDQIEAHNSYLGGGFGGRIYQQRAEDAARLSQIMQKPIHLFNDREQEFMNGYYRPGNHHVMRAVIEGGRWVAIEHEQASAAMFISNNAPKIVHDMMGGDFASTNHGASIFYDIPNRTASIYDIEVPFPSGVWRAVGTWMNCFPIESFMDEVAQELQQDPIELRLQFLNGENENHVRARNLIKAVREKSKWHKPKAMGVGRGFAFCIDRQTLVAAVVEVTIVDGNIRVTRFTHATDCGLVVNPEGARTQVEGCIMMGISAALYEEQTVKDGKFVSSNFHQYPLATLWDTPEIEVIFVEGREKPAGMGEPPITVVAPAIANAIFDLTGQRLRSLPLRLES